MDIQVNKDMWEIVPDESRLAAEYIHKIWVLAGRPNRLESEGAWKVMDSLMNIWGAMYPEELIEFKNTIKDDQSEERTVHDANKLDGGHIPIAYPQRLLQFIKVYFPEEKLQNRKLILKFIRRYPVLKVTKYSL